MRIFFGEFQHNAGLCPAEAVDGLIIIADYEQIIFRQSKHFDNIILHRIDILKFIDQDIPVLLLPYRKDLRMFQKQIPAAEYHIIKVQLAFGRHDLMVFTEDRDKGFLFDDAAGIVIILRRDPFIFDL